MVEIEGKILNTSVSILIDPGACWSYVAPKIVDLCKLGKVKHDKTWPVQLSTNTKQKVSEIVKECEVKLNGFLTKVNLNILPLALYDIIIGMDWLDILEFQEFLIQPLWKSLNSTHYIKNTSPFLKNSRMYFSRKSTDYLRNVT